MFFHSLSFALALVPFVFSKTIDVQVGKGGLQFSPEAVFANAGDQVVFHFVAKNHSVTQSSFAAPCSKKDGGFDSGFHPVAANSTEAPPTFAITVNDTQPIWVFCAQAEDTPASHCGAGMIFAINCGAEGSNNSFSNFQAEAKAIGASLSAAAAQASQTPETAAYGAYTLPPTPEATLATQTITLDSTSIWTTTYTSYPGSNPTPVSVGGTTHVVVVGGSNGLVFDPPHIDARPRDTVVFEFHQKNHSVAQSSFADPCRKLNANGTVGFDSGFMPVDDNATIFPTFNVTVNDTSPVWVYCRQQTPSSHCGQGMVFAINSVESSERNFSAFQEVAEALNGTLQGAATSNNNSSTGSTPGSGAAATASISTMSTVILLGAALFSLL